MRLYLYNDKALQKAIVKYKIDKKLIPPDVQS